jgi:hypothetical protein
MVAKMLVTLFVASALAVPSAAGTSDKPKDKGCVHKHKHRVATYGAKHVSPYYTPSFSGVRNEYGAPYGRPVISSPYSPTRITYRRRCATTVG